MKHAIAATALVVASIALAVIPGICFEMLEIYTANQRAIAAARTIAITEVARIRAQSAVDQIILQQEFAERQLDRQLERLMRK